MILELGRSGESTLRFVWSLKRISPKEDLFRGAWMAWIYRRFSRLLQAVTLTTSLEEVSSCTNSGLDCYIIGFYSESLPRTMGTPLNNLPSITSAPSTNLIQPGCDLAHLQPSSYIRGAVLGARCIDVSLREHKSLEELVAS